MQCNHSCLTNNRNYNIISVTAYLKTLLPDQNFYNLQYLSFTTCSDSLILPYKDTYKTKPGFLLVTLQFIEQGKVTMYLYVAYLFMYLYIYCV